MKKFQYNSPVILSFFIISFLVLILGWLTNGRSTGTLFSVYRSSLRDPLTFIRLFGHVLGHADFDHFFGNMLMLLVVGPPLEERYGSRNPSDRTCIRLFADVPVSAYGSAGCKRYRLYADHAVVAVRHGKRKNPCYPGSGGISLPGTGILFPSVHPG